MADKLITRQPKNRTFLILNCKIPPEFKGGIMANKRKAVVIQNEIIRLKELGHSKNTIARILNINREMVGG